MLRRIALTVQSPSRYNFAALPSAGFVNAMLRMLGRPIRTVLRWQFLTSIAATIVGGLVEGVPGALSAAIGGFISIFAGTVAGAVAAMGRTQAAWGVVVAALLAEIVKLGLMVMLLWIVLVTWDEIVVGAFIASFLVTALIFAMAFFVRDH